MLFIPTCLPKWQQVLHEVVAHVKIQKLDINYMYTESEIFACNKLCRYLQRQTDITVAVMIV